MNFRNLKWMKLGQFILSGLKAPHIMCTCSIFFLNSIHGFSLVWKEKLFEGDVRRSREKVFTYTAFFGLSSCEKIDTKTAV